jgi:hypothetical protein
MISTKEEDGGRIDDITMVSVGVLEWVIFFSARLYCAWENRYPKLNFSSSYLAWVVATAVISIVRYIQKLTSMGDKSRVAEALRSKLPVPEALDICVTI